MNKKALKFIRTVLSMILLVALFLLSIANLAYFHEHVHKAIFKSYDINSIIEYDFLWLGGKTIADRPCPTEECKSLNNWNEIIGYALSALVISLWCMIFAYRIFKD